MTVYRIHQWENFKAQVLDLHPETIFYLGQPHPLRKPPLGLRMTFYHNHDMYVFVDYANGVILRKTGIRVTNHEDKIHAEVREQDIHDFLIENFPWIKLSSLPPFMY